MAAAGTFPDAWQERCLIGIIPQDGSEIAFGALTDELSFEFSDKDFEGRPNMIGGRIRKVKAQEDETMTLKVVPLTAGVDGEAVATGITQLFHPQDTPDSTQPLQVDNTHNRIYFGIILLWSETLPATSYVPKYPIP